MKPLLMLAAVGAAVAVAGATPVHADPDSNAVNIYLSELNKQQVPYSSEASIVKLGESICDNIGSGTCIQMVIAALEIPSSDTVN